MNWNEPLIKQKDYSKEEYAAQKRKSFGVAKRSIIMSQLTCACGYNLFFAFGMFLLLFFGSSAIPYFTDIEIDVSMATAFWRGGVFTNIMVVLMLLFPVFAFWYIFAYKRLEIICIHLDGSLAGAMEVSRMAQREQRRNAVEKGVGLAPSHYRALGGAISVTERYLMVNNEKIAHVWLWANISKVLMACQVVLAIVCVLVLVLQ